MARIIGMGGYFVRSDDPERLAGWYRDVLGLGTDENGEWAQEAGTGVFAPLARDSESFPASQQTMMNLRVEDLDGVLDRLRSAGADVADEQHEAEGIGRFGWVFDPDGNRIELWEPPQQ
jgi:predicted enzyme related to lactoylglutathione lyase